MTYCINDIENNLPPYRARWSAISTGTIASLHSVTLPAVQASPAWIFRRSFDDDK